MACSSMRSTNPFGPHQNEEPKEETVKNSPVRWSSMGMRAMPLAESWAPGLPSAGGVRGVWTITYTQYPKARSYANELFKDLFE